MIFPEEGVGEVLPERIFKLLIREKKMILAAVVVFVVLGSVFYLTGEKQGHATVDLLLRFENVNRGQYPDGSPFDKENIIGSAVVEEVVETLELEQEGLDEAVLRRHLDVVGVMSQAEIREAQRLQDEGRDPGSVFPSEYRISLLEGDRLGLEEELQKEILTAVVQSYTQRFRRVYAGLESPLPSRYLSGDILQDYDYPFIPDLLESQVEQLREYVEEMQESNETFRSRELGYSFSDVQRGLESLQENQVAAIRAVIRANRLTTDPESTLRRYAKMIEEQEQALARKEQEALFARDLLRDLEASAPPGAELAEDMTDIVEVLLEHEYLTTLLEQSLEAGLEAEELQVELQHYRGELELLLGAGEVEAENGDEEEVPAEALEAAAAQLSEPSPAQMERADGKIEAAVARIGDYLEIIETMRWELLADETERAILILREPYRETVGWSPARLVLAWVFLGLLVGSGGAYLKDLRRNQHKAKSKASPGSGR